ncbi:hypothetical protein Q9L58_006933 [Maublancomyces gigas]|uniref:Uncharacterized protein n=1 Tax=Discina gigas TaxID=1032678 RepID=A0ABR3GE54_9PEZI
MKGTDPAIGLPPIPSADRPTPCQLYTEITRRAEQARFMLLLQEEIEYRRARGITTCNNLEEHIQYGLESKEAGTSTAPTSLFSMAKSHPLPATIERKGKAEITSLPPSVILSGLTMIEREWLVNIRLEAETDWKSVALLFEERFKKMITPRIAKATSDFLFHASRL